MDDLFDTLIRNIVESIKKNFATNRDFEFNLEQVSREKLWPLLSDSKSGYINGQASGYGYFRVHYYNVCKELDIAYDGDEMRGKWKKQTTEQRRNWKKHALDTRYDYYINWMRLNLDQTMLKTCVNDNLIFDSIVGKEIFAWEQKVLSVKVQEIDGTDTGSFTSESTSGDYN